LDARYLLKIFKINSSLNSKKKTHKEEIDGNAKIALGISPDN